MWIFSLICAVLIIIFCVVFYNYEREPLYKEERHEHILSSLYGAGAKIQDLLEKKNLLFKNQEFIKSFEKIYPRDMVKHNVRLWHYKRNTVMLLIIFITLLFMSLYGLKANTENQYAEGVLIRPETAASQKIRLSYISDKHSGELDYELNSRKMSKEEFYNFFEEQQEMLIKEVLNENESADEVRSSLYFPKYLDNTAIELTWKTSDSSVIKNDGSVKNEMTAEEGEAVVITVCASYFDEECILEFPVIVRRKLYTDGEMFELKLMQRLHELDKEYEHESKFILPEEIDGSKIAWLSKKDNTILVIALIGAVAALAAAGGYKQNIFKKEKMRNRQMLSDYSEIVSELTLLLEAGLTVRASFERISADYKKRRGLRKTVQYAYEEVLYCVKRIESGVSEAEAYKEFGKRCGLLPYIRLSAAISQNLKRGTKGIVPILRQEAAQAFAVRKENAKRLGEEAGTKLLMPMMAYLIIVIVIVVVPAMLQLV